MREIVIDTETTGLDHAVGHRIVEIACIELMNHMATGRAFHRLVNPECEMSAEAFQVHGLSTEILREHPVFPAVVEELLAFIGGDPLVIHNAEFDLGFINAELARCGKAALDLPCVDTVQLARKRFPGAPASLDALCRRFAIDLTQRQKHSARLDAELLASVYLELIGGRQPGLDFAIQAGAAVAGALIARVARLARPHAPSMEEEARHRSFLQKIKGALWLSEA